MEFLASQFKQIHRQLRGTTLSQRIAVGLLAILLIVAMWGMIEWGGEPDWAPLLDQSFTMEEIQQVQRELSLAGVNSKVKGDRVEIQAGDDERQRLQAYLVERGALPVNTSLGYAALVKENSVFVGEQKSRWLESRGLEAELSGVLRRFQGIKDARVLITVPPKRGFGRTESGSSASVALSLSEGQELDKARVMAIANFVAGAVPGLELKNIKITDGKRPYRTDIGEQMPTELLEQQQKIEDHYTQKISNQLRNIEGAVVNVHAKLRSASERSQQEVYGPPVIDRETSTTEEMTGGSKAAEPSVRPNTRAGLGDGGTASMSTKEENDSSFNNKRDVKMTVVDELRGSVERVSASVSIPRSYLERILAGQAKGKDGGTIEKIAAMELPRIRTVIKPLIDATKDDQVVVDWYYDLPVGTQPVAESTPTGVVALAKDYGPKVGLGLLALGGFFMVMRIARKASAAIGMPSAAATVGAPGPNWGTPNVGLYDEPSGDVSPLRSLESGSMAVGEARELQGVLMAHEVDENTVRTQQIVKQIGQLVKEDASTAAGIINQWVVDEA